MGAHGENPVRELASARWALYDDYFDHNGHRRVTSDDTRRPILARSRRRREHRRSAREALARQDQDAANEMLRRCASLEAGDPALARLEARAPEPRTDGGSWRLEVETEAGDRYVTEGPWRGEADIGLALPPSLPLGYHRVRLSFGAGGREWRNEQTLIVVPAR